LEHLEHQERSNIRSDQGATLEDIVVVGANRSLARTKLMKHESIIPLMFCTNRISLMFYIITMTIRETGLDNKLDLQNEV